MSTVTLVTGGNRGIGREVCRQLADRGHTVMLTARSAQAAAAAARAAGAEPLPLDVTDPGSIAAAARQVGERHGKLDVLVNNAAIDYDTGQRAIDADLAVVREAAETNLYGPWLLVQEFLPLLRASGHGRIVNVSSEAASLASMGAGTPAYNASKVALNALTRMLAAELRGDGILVNAICPGWVATDLWVRNTEGMKKEFGVASEAEARKVAAKKNSLGRMGKPEELANATVFLCSERASYITGVSLNLDGGRLKGLW